MAQRFEQIYKRGYTGDFALTKWIIILGCVLSLMYMSFLLGKSRAETKIIKEQVEVIKYVEKKKADIYSKPNSSRADLLRLFRSGEL